jgi:hypothetical protein
VWVNFRLGRFIQHQLPMVCIARRCGSYSSKNKFFQGTLGRPRTAPSFRDYECTTRPGRYRGSSKRARLLCGKRTQHGNSTLLRNWITDRLHLQWHSRGCRGMKSSTWEGEFCSPFINFPFRLLESFHVTCPPSDSVVSSGPARQLLSLKISQLSWA